MVWNCKCPNSYYINGLGITTEIMKQVCCPNGGEGVWFSSSQRESASEADVWLYISINIHRIWDNKVLRKVSKIWVWMYSNFMYLVFP